MTAPPTRAPTTTGPHTATRENAPPAVPRGQTRRAHSSNSTSATATSPASRSSPTRAPKRWTSTSRTCSPAFRPAHHEAQDEGLRGIRLPRPGRRTASSTWTRSPASPLSASRTAGIVFLDEIDKIAGREGGHGPDISREGVQRDILPIVEGTTVNTKYGMVSTDHILFIAAGAFHVSKPTDLIPELQGRFPIRVELKSLTVEDFVRILTEPKRRWSSSPSRCSKPKASSSSSPRKRSQEMAQLRLPGQRDHRKHRRAPPAHHPRARARRDQLPGARPREAATPARPRRAARSKTAQPPAAAWSAQPTRASPEKVLSVTRDYVQQQVASIVKNQDLSRYIL